MKKIFEASPLRKIRLEHRIGHYFGSPKGLNKFETPTRYWPIFEIERLGI